MHIKQAIEVLMKRHGVNAKTLAVNLGQNCRTIRNFLAKSDNATAKSLKRYSDAIGCELSDIFIEEEKIAKIRAKESKC